MKIQSLSYLLIETTNLHEWADYAKDVVGLMKNDSLSDEQNLYLRMDEKSFRFHITLGDSKRFLAAGFSLADKAAFDDAKSELDQANIDYEDLGDEIATLRCVELSTVCLKRTYLPSTSIVFPIFVLPTATYDLSFNL